MDLYYLILSPVTIAIAWLSVFLVERRYSQLHDKLLILFLICSTIVCYSAIRGIVVGTNDYAFIVLDNLETLLGLSICPLLFLYIRAVSRDSRWHNSYLWLFFPALAISVAGTVLSFIVGWDRILEYRLLTATSSAATSADIEWNLYRLFNITIFNTVFLIMSVVLTGIAVCYLVKYYGHLFNYYSSLEDSAIKKIQRFLISSIVLLVTISLMIVFINKVICLNIQFNVAISCWLTALTFIVARNAYGIVLKDNEPEKIRLESSKSSGSNEESIYDTVSVLVRQWEIRDDKPYCKEGLTISNVAKEMNVSPRVLSGYINHSLMMNFGRWINTLRVAEAKRMISSDPNQKLMYVAEMCGFSDSAVFSRSFKSIEGCTPQQYRDSL